MGELGTEKARPSLNHPRAVSEADTKETVPLINGSRQTAVLSLGKWMFRTMHQESRSSGTWTVYLQ